MRARKRFAQHFLEKAWVAKLVAAFDPRPDQAVVEIGPGRGALTRPLADKAGRVLAIEIDRDLAATLEADRPDNVSIICDDVLDVDLAPVIATWIGAPIGPGRTVRIVGNLPYHISSPILFRILDLAAATQGVTDATLMLQKEVADRLLGRVGTGDYGVLTILTALHADVTRLLSLPPGAFRPAPKVHSAVVQLRFRPPQVQVGDPRAFTRMVRSMFTQRRKTLHNALKPFAADMQASADTALAAAGIDGRRRPETLRLEEVAALARAFQQPDVAAVL